ncbi:MAG TPA: TonB-dependent receptor plug domain-containing protein [Bacteroidales bacterium]|nr:TonB-dependent receptor plug domain-containing protein [Bacteroidales bacterium]
MKSRVFLAMAMALLVMFSPSLNAQKTPKKLTITGKVVDPDQKPVSGVSIMVDNKNTNVKTNENGIYKIKVDRSAKTLTAFSLFNGMKEAEINGQEVINFSLYHSKLNPLTKDKTQSEEAVEVGYGKMKKDEMTSPVRNVNGQSKRYKTYSNIYDMIRAEVPGARGSGKTIVLTEPSSIMLSNEPLLVVDGVVTTSIDGIDPKMVKSISVLRGPSASIYGARGANGVILIDLLKGNEEK